MGIKNAMREMYFDEFSPKTRWYNIIVSRSPKSSDIFDYNSVDYSMTLTKKGQNGVTSHITNGVARISTSESFRGSNSKLKIMSVQKLKIMSFYRINRF